MRHLLILLLALTTCASVCHAQSTPPAAPIDTLVRADWAAFGPSSISTNEYGIFINVSGAIQIKVAFDDHLFYIDGVAQHTGGYKDPSEFHTLGQIFAPYEAITVNVITNSETSRTHYLKAKDGSWHTLLVPFPVRPSAAR